MTSPPLDITHGRQCRAWHAITALGQHRQSDYVEHGMTSPPLGNTHGRQHRAWHDITALGQHTRSATSCVACHYSPWTANTVRRRRAWHAITALGQHTRLNDVGRGMPSSPLGSTNGQTTSGVARHHRPCTAHTAERRRAWHDITAFGLHARLNDVGHGMTSLN